MGTAVSLDFGPEVSAFISAAASGAQRNGQPAREIAAFSPRGEGKTWSALAAMIAHAQQHQLAGYPLPVKWAGVTDTFRSHTEKTHDSLLAPGWGGVWRLEDGGHEARCVIDGQCLVRVRLFGIEDQGAMNRLRMECHGLWFEEPAPALTVSSGISEDAWSLGLTSQRLPSHCKPAILTTNYPEDEHWTWQRFVVRQHPGSCYFRIPKGERSSPADRAEWERALAGRPDLQRRLLEGKPGMVILGEQVAVGFNEDLHAPDGLRLRPDRTATLWIGQDGGLTPTTVIGQREGRRRKILAALASEHDGIRQHVRGMVLPWLSEHCPWALEEPEQVQVIYDPSIDADGQGDTEANPLKILRALLPGHYRPGPVKWDPRREALLNALGDLSGGEAALQIDPVQGRGLVKALVGGWHYPTGPDGKVRRDEPVKNHPHSDYGDALCYLLCGMSPAKPEGKPRKPYHATTAFNPMTHGYPTRKPVGVGVLIRSRAT